MHILCEEEKNNLNQIIWHFLVNNFIFNLEVLIFYTGAVIEVRCLSKRHAFFLILNSLFYMYSLHTGCPQKSVLKLFRKKMKLMFIKVNILYTM